MVNYTNVVIEKTGEVVDNEHIYRVNKKIVNGVLSRLYCSIEKYSIEVGGEFIGGISFENGRQVAEFVQSDDIVIHVAKFQEILSDQIAYEEVD